MIFAAKAADCQNISATNLQKALHFSSKNIGNKLFMLGKDLPVNTISSPTTVEKPLLSPSFYASNLGFFCKKEIKLEKTLKFPLKFRLGSVEQCDRMEGKRGAVKYR